MPKLTWEILHRYAHHRGYTFGGRSGNYFLRPDDGVTATWLFFRLDDAARFLARQPVIRSYLKAA